MVIDRYTKQRKAERNRKLYLFWQMHQDLSLRELGRLFNLTKQRVSSIIARESEIIEKEKETNKVAV